VLLANLGTPDSPSVGDVRRYLREFLSDPLVLDMPAPLRWLLLHGVILRTRPARSAAAYAQIWTDAGSPLLVHGRALRDRLAASLARRTGREVPVAIGMRYGRPSLETAARELAAAGVQSALVFPLFPQWSSAATGSAEAAARRACRAVGLGAPAIAEPFYSEPGFIRAFAGLLAPRLAAFRPDHVLLSYHGLPERQVRAQAPEHCLTHTRCCDAPGRALARCYRAQCYATSRALVTALGISPDRVSTSFQSRLGRATWIGPFTEERLPQLRADGVRRLAIACPAFVADCLETLEEIGIRARDRWRELGGEAFELMPSLNAEPAWAEALAEMCEAQLRG
jgi:ferrochelatase